MKSRNSREGVYLGRIQGVHLRGPFAEPVRFMRRNPDGSLTLRKIVRPPSIHSALCGAYAQTRGGYTTLAWLGGVKFSKGSK
jgi:hypothetical protein